MSSESTKGKLRELLYDMYDTTEEGIDVLCLQETNGGTKETEERWMDIITNVETETQSKIITIHKHRQQEKNEMKKGIRSSGGLAIITTKEVGQIVEIKQNSPDIQSIKLSNEQWISDVYISNIYLPPIGSRYFNNNSTITKVIEGIRETHAQALEKDIIIEGGDYNMNTDNITIHKRKKIDDCDTIREYMMIDEEEHIQRENGIIKKNNNRAQEIIDEMTMREMKMMNRTSQANSGHTFSRGEMKSTLDYVFINAAASNHSSMKITSPILSDHNALDVKINMKMKKQKKEEEEWEWRWIIPKEKKEREEKGELFKEKLRERTMITRLTEEYKDLKNNNNEDVGKGRGNRIIDALRKRIDEIRKGLKESADQIYGKRVKKRKEGKKKLLSLTIRTLRRKKRKIERREKTMKQRLIRRKNNNNNSNNKMRKRERKKTMKEKSEEERRQEKIDGYIERMKKRKKEINEEYEEAIKKEREEKIITRLEEMDDYLYSNPKLLWKKIKEMANIEDKKRQSITKIKDKKGEILTTIPAIAERVAEYFKDLGKARIVNEEVESIFNKAYARDKKEMKERIEEEKKITIITQEEVAKIITRIKSGKAPGPDGITNTLLKEGKEEVARWLSEFFSACMNEGWIPEAWTKGIIITIYKKGSEMELDNYRGITLMDTMGKIFASVIAERVGKIVDPLSVKKTKGEGGEEVEWNNNNKFIKEHGTREDRENSEYLLSENQAGFREGRNSTDPLFLLNEVIEQYYDKEKKVYVCFIDFKKAYDSIHRKAMIHILKKHIGETEPKLWRMIDAMYEKTESRARVGEELSEEFPIERGVKQGCTLSPLLFDIVMENITRALDRVTIGKKEERAKPGCWIKVRRKNKEGTKLESKETLINNLMYADDLALVAESKQQLQVLVDTTVKFGESMGMEVNIDKSKVVVFTKENTTNPKVTIKIGKEKVEQVKHFKYLGVWFSGNSKDRWGKHKKEVLKKLKRVVWSVRRLRLDKGHLSIKIGRLIFFTLIRPVIEYAAEIWWRGEWKEIEKEVRKHLKRCLRVKSTTSNMVLHGELGVMDMVTRRDLALLRWSQRIMRQHPAMLVRQVWMRGLFDMHKMEDEGRKGEASGRMNWYFYWWDEIIRQWGIGRYWIQWRKEMIKEEEDEGGGMITVKKWGKEGKKVDFLMIGEDREEVMRMRKSKGIRKWIIAIKKAAYNFYDTKWGKGRTKSSNGQWYFKHKRAWKHEMESYIGYNYQWQLTGMRMMMRYDGWVLSLKNQERWNRKKRERMEEMELMVPDNVRANEGYCVACEVKGGGRVLDDAEHSLDQCILFKEAREELVREVHENDWQAFWRGLKRRNGGGRVNIADLVLISDRKRNGKRWFKNLKNQGIYQGLVRKYLQRILTIKEEWWMEFFGQLPDGRRLIEQRVINGEG